MDEVNGATDTVPLEPFVHQVSGHSSFQQFDKHTVCKPLFSKELKFYQEMPAALKPFIPQFKGVVTAQIKEDCQGNPRLIVHPNKSMFFDNSDVQKYLSDSDDDMRNSLDGEFPEDHPSYNCKSQKYLILENVISRYHHPCILDLKMGTQIHSDYKTSEDEMRRRRSKWEKTTASTLGVRLGGMKVYLVDYEDFLCKNKNEGSQLNEGGFEEALTSFFYNGRTFRCELIDCFLKKLESFLEVMEKDLISYRFYNSSLLLVYEGEISRSNIETSKGCTWRTCDIRSSSGEKTAEQCTCTANGLDQMDMRMIDFAHVSHDDTTTENSSCASGPDKGYIFGLKSLIRILRKIQVEHIIEEFPHRKISPHSVYDVS